MQITEETIVLIEKALGISLYEGQKQYLLNNGTYWFGGRATGKTLAYCIKLALSKIQQEDSIFSKMEMNC